MRQTVPVSFRICFKLVSFTRSTAFCQSMKQARNSSSMSKVRSDIILIIPVASLVAFPYRNENYLLKVRLHFSFQSIF